MTNQPQANQANPVPAVQTAPTPAQPPIPVKTPNFRARTILASVAAGVMVGFLGFLHGKSLPAEHISIKTPLSPELQAESKRVREQTAKTGKPTVDWTHAEGNKVPKSLPDERNFARKAFDTVIDKPLTAAGAAIGIKKYDEDVTEHNNKNPFNWAVGLSVLYLITDLILARARGKGLTARIIYGNGDAADAYNGQISKRMEAEQILLYQGATTVAEHQRVMADLANLQLPPRLGGAFVDNKINSRTTIGPTIMLRKLDKTGHIEEISDNGYIAKPGTTIGEKFGPPRGGGGNPAP